MGVFSSTKTKNSENEEESPYLRGIMKGLIGGSIDVSKRTI
jgi:hypothetical protein